MSNIYLHNWYKRNEQTYNYGNPVRLNEHFTGSLYTMSDITKMLSNENSLVTELRDIIKSRFGINPPIKISSDAETSYTDGKRIVVSSKEIDDIADPYKKLDLLYGFAFHEIAHCLYTDFDNIRSHGVCYNSVIKHIHNILEDEEIEIRLSKKNPGYERYFAYLKNVIFENGTCGKKEFLEDRINNLDEIMMILFCLIRYPKYINHIKQELLDKYESVFIKINDILVNNNCPGVIPFTECEMYEDSFYDGLNITHTTIPASFEIYKYLVEYIAEDFKNQEKEFDEDPNSFGNIIDGIGMPSSIGEDAGVEQIMPTFYDEDTYSGSNDGDGNTNTRGDRVRTPNPDGYMKMFNEMRPYYSLVEGTIVPNDVKLKDNLVLNRFRRNGNLDTNRLADAMQNINTVYTQRVNQQVKVNNTEPKYAFVVMIDESGSMDACKRDVFAHKMAVLYAEVFSKFKGVEYYVYGHGDKINAYLTKENTNKYVIANYDKQGGQNDAFSYRWIINDVKRQTNLPIIVLNITDFYYHSKDTDLSSTIRYFKDNNVSFNMIMLGCNYTEREIAFTKRLLDGQVIGITDIHNEQNVQEGLEKLSTMIRNNYERFNRK